MAKINDFILSFMFLLVGVILIGVVADETTSATQLNTVSAENITLAVGTPVSLANNQLQSFTSLVNASNISQTYPTTNYTVDLDAGTVTSALQTGLATAAYTWREVGDGTARTLTNLVIIFFAIGIFLASVGFAVRGLREAGVF